jgi:hypothetical protein
MRGPDEPVYVFVMSTTRNRRLMRGIADHMLRDADPDEFLADHLEIERWRLQELEMPPNQIESELAAIARTARAMVWKIRREARA